MTTNTASTGDLVHVFTGRVGHSLIHVFFEWYGVVVSINEVALRRARLVLGRATIFSGHCYLNQWPNYKFAGVRRLAVENGPNIFQMLLVFFVDKK